MSIGQNQRILPGKLMSQILMKGEKGKEKRKRLLKGRNNNKKRGGKRLLLTEKQQQHKQANQALMHQLQLREQELQPIQISHH